MLRWKGSLTKSFDLRCAASRSPRGGTRQVLLAVRAVPGFDVNGGLFTALNVALLAGKRS